MTLTLQEWFSYPPQRRAIIERQRYLLQLDPTTGATVLAPVTILTTEVSQ